MEPAGEYSGVSVLDDDVVLLDGLLAAVVEGHVVGVWSFSLKQRADAFDDLGAEEVSVSMMEDIDGVFVGGGIIAFRDPRLDVVGQSRT